MNNVKLCICIPTYNRSKFLEVCLEHLLPQVKCNEDVEVIVIDNASTDNTKGVMNAITSEYSNIHYYRNEMNIGYSGNQVRCIEYSNGQYTAILSDDDVYTDNLVDDIVDIINKREYSFIALNYYSFLEDIGKSHQANFAPTNDVIFDRAYDIMNYPSVGHFSGFIFNSRLAKETIREMLQKHSFEEYEKYRGVISDIAHRSLSKTSIPSYFFGQRKLANRIPKTVDYDSLNHICLDYYEYFLRFQNEGIINEADLDYRKRLVLSWLPRAILTDAYRKSDDELKRITDRLTIYFKKDTKFKYLINPLLYLSNFSIIKYIFKYLHKAKRYFKYRN